MVPGVLSANVLNVSTEGGNLGAHEGFARSSADVAEVIVGSVLGPNLTIQAVHSECLSNGDGSSGLTRLVGVAGVAGFPELPEPNSVVPAADLPAGIAEIRLNEQIIENSTGSTRITVNAVRITLLPDPVTGAVLELILAQSRCGAFGPDVNTGQVAVIKQAPADAQDVEFTFTITCPGMAGSPFTRTVTGSGTTDPVINVPAGSQCTVAETPLTGFEDQPSQTTAAVVSGGTRTVTFVNTRTTQPPGTGAVAVIKQAPADAQGVVFTFTITCAGVAGSPFTRTVTGSGSTAAVANLPVGTVCTAAETPLTGFVNQPNQTFGAVTAGTTRTVTFVNARTTAPPVGPTVTVGKSANPISRPQPGGTFTFTVTATNTSNVPVVITSITDDVHGNLNGRGTCAIGATLAPGATYTCSFSVQFTGNSGAIQTDRVTVTVVDAAGRTGTGTSNGVTISITAPGTPPVVDDRDPSVIINNDNEVTCVSNSTATSAGVYRIAQVNNTNSNTAECVSSASAAGSIHTSAPKGKILARTGVDSLALGAFAMALMAAGSLMLSSRASTARRDDL